MWLSASLIYKTYTFAIFCSEGINFMMQGEVNIRWELVMDAYWFDFKLPFFKSNFQPTNYGPVRGSNVAHRPVNAKLRV